MKNTIQGKTAVVTGASSGLGADFARRLAALGCNLIIVARRAEQLQQLRQEITGRYPVAVEVIAMDLAAQDAPQVLYDRLKAGGQQVDILINNAGLGLHGEFLEIPWEQERNMLELDIVTLVQMTKLFARDMASRRFGYILQIASIGAYQPTPSYASYAAAKSFVLSFGEALHYELGKYNITCTVLSPGNTSTEFHQVAGQKLSLYQRRTIMGSAEVARIGIEAMLQGKSSVVAGRFNAFMAFLTRFVPRRMATALAHRSMTTG